MHSSAAHIENANAPAQNTADHTAEAAGPARTAPLSPRAVAHLDCTLRKPDYPPASLRLGETGTVVIALDTDATGRVRAAHVATSSHYARLDAAARDAVLASRCRPYVEDGTPVPARADVPVTFNLDE